MWQSVWTTTRIKIDDAAAQMELRWVADKRKFYPALHSNLHLKVLSSTAFKTSKENAEIASVGITALSGCECVQALTGEKRAKMLRGSERDRKLNDT